MSNEVALSGIAVALYITLRSKKKAIKEPPRWWMRGLFKDRNKHGHNLLDTLRLEDLLFILNVFWKWSDHVFRKRRRILGYQFMLPIGLQSLSVSSQVETHIGTSLMYTFKISKQIISEFLPEVCTAITI
ncbi:hypothetical protein J437_LFUL009938, partial [Ladona fulva]